MPGSGRGGISWLKISEQTAKPVPVRNTAAGLTSQIRPSAAGRTTAAIWLMVKDTAAVGAMFLIVLAWNIFGDRLRDALDPRLKNV